MSPIPLLSAGKFVDPNLPAGLVPFNVQTIGGFGGNIYVTYAPGGPPGSRTRACRPGSPMLPRARARAHLIASKNERFSVRALSRAGSRHYMDRRSPG